MTMNRMIDRSAIRVCQPLPARAINALKNSDIQVVADLAQKTEEELAQVKNLGEKSIDEIKTALESLPDRRTPNRKDWAKLAASWQPILDERIALLEAMKDKLDGCIGCGCLSLDTCALYNPGDVAAGRGVGPRYLLGDPPPG